MLPSLHSTNKQAGILILFFRIFSSFFPVTCLSGRWARGDGRSVITLWTKKQKSINGPSLEKLWLHFNLLCFKKGSIHLNVFQKKTKNVKKPQYVVPQVSSLQKVTKFFSFVEMTQLLFSEEKEWWNSTDCAMTDLCLLFLPTKTFSVLCKDDTEKQIIK